MARNERQSWARGAGGPLPACRGRPGGGRIPRMKNTRVALPALIASTLALAAHPAGAAEDTRGKRGWYIGGGGGAVLGTGVDDQGRDTGTYVGSGGQFRFGEEVIDRLTLGLEFGGAGGSADDFAAGLGGFFLQATYRPGWGTEGLVALLGTGVGGGSLTPEKSVKGAPDGAGGGALFQLGLSYELDFFGAPDEGVAFAPFVRWHFMPSTPDNAVQLSAFTLGLEVPFYAGR